MPLCCLVIADKLIKPSDTIPAGTAPDVIDYRLCNAVVVSYYPTDIKLTVPAVGGQHLDVGPYFTSLIFGDFEVSTAAHLWLV